MIIKIIRKIKIISRIAYSKLSNKCWIIPQSTKTEKEVMMEDIKIKYQQMYEFENNSKLYEYKFKDIKIPMWMYIRSYFIREITRKEFNDQNKNIQKIQKNIDKNIFNKYIIRNPFFSYKKEILFAVWDYRTLKQNKKGLVFDQLIYPYLEMFPNKTTTLMDGNITNRYELKCAHPNWKMDDIFLDILRYIKLLKKDNNVCFEDNKTIRNLIKFINQNCPLKMDRNLKNNIIWQLEEFAVNAKYLIKIFEVYLSIIKPKVAVICCASYLGLLRTSFVLACRNKKITTAELQHGLVCKYHSFYYYCDYIIDNIDCNMVLPDYYLTFGKYWNSQIKIPHKCNVIGCVKPIVKDVIQSKDLLFCAGAEFNKYINFLDKFVPELDKSTKLYFRFHPLISSKKQRDRFAKYSKYSNFIFANERDLFPYLKKCRYVIVDASTVCYEALSMGRIVFVFNSEMSRLAELDNISDVHLFDNVNDFIKIWDKRDSLKSEYHSEFFNINYKENYMKFLKKCGVNVF